MIIEMGFDLRFRLLNEAKAASITGEGGNGAEHEAAGVPQRRQSTGCAAEFGDPLFAPREVIVFLFCCCEQMITRLRRAREYGLTVVEGLRCNFTGMVDTHQPYARRARLRIELGIFAARRRNR